MTDALLIRGGRLIDPVRGTDIIDDLLIVDARIAPFDRSLSPREYDVINAENMVVSPGFIDLHCHLREPGFEKKETISTGALAAARGGFTTVCCMPNTSPPLDTPAAVARVKTAAADSVVRVLPIGCVSRGQQGRELADLRGLVAAGVVAFSDDGRPVPDSGLMRRALERARILGLPVIDHCEDLALSEGGFMNEGEVSRRLGISGMPAEAEEIIVSRDLALARLTGAHVHIAHASTAGSVELIAWAKSKGVRVTAEATPHHLTLTENAVLGMKTAAKVSPPLRTRDDVSALVRGLKEGVIDCVATDHAPHTREDKACAFEYAAFGISGLETALGSLLGLVHNGQMTLPDLLARLVAAPAGILGLKPGTLQPGAPADIAIFDPDKEWTVDPASFASKGKNTPLAGVKLRGKVMGTVCRGRLVFRDEALPIETGDRLREELV
ncbi:MAG: dihydroorotase [Chloroflexi bacterium]|nr:dihydroorotase [Chloroflexota bacterium]